MYAHRISDHTNMNSTADSVVTRVNAVIRLGTRYISAAPSSRQKQENSRPSEGTAAFDRRANAFGAWFSPARPYSMRLVEKMPLFAEEVAEVSTTKLIRLAAAGMPASTNSSTNGLLSASTSRHGVTAMIAASAST